MILYADYDLRRMYGFVAAARGRTARMENAFCATSISTIMKRSDFRCGLFISSWKLRVTMSGAEEQGGFLQAFFKYGAPTPERLLILVDKKDTPPPDHVLMFFGRRATWLTNTRDILEQELLGILDA